jgi:hypothetical protein
MNESSIILENYITLYETGTETVGFVVTLAPTTLNLRGCDGKSPGRCKPVTVARSLARY